MDETNLLLGWSAHIDRMNSKRLLFALFFYKNMGFYSI